MAKQPPAWATALTVFSLWLAGCASAPAPAQTPVITLPVTLLAPTATVVPLTATPVPPTVTPTVAPTPAASPASALGAALQAALLKTSAAESYRIEISMTGSGQPFAALSGDEQNTDVTIMAVSGQYSRQNAAFSISGLAAALLGGGQDGAQVIAADGNTYLRGPAPLLGAFEERWYILPDEQAGMAQAPLHMLQFLRQFAGDNAGQFGFQRESSQELEGQLCEAHIGDAPATRAALASFGANIAPGAGSLSMRSGQFKIWSCSDGYVHRLEMNFELGSADDENKVILFKADIRLRDHGAPIVISAPADASALDLPGLQPPAP